MCLDIVYTCARLLENSNCKIFSCIIGVYLAGKVIYSLLHKITRQLLITTNLDVITANNFTESNRLNKSFTGMTQIHVFVSESCTYYICFQYCTFL